MSHLKQSNDNTIVWKVLIVACFAMLSMLTWAAKPIAETVEKMQKKQKAIAVLLVCERIASMEETYGEYMKNNFISGCLWETRNILKALRPKKSDEVDKIFQEASSLEYDGMRDHCANGGNAYMAEGRIKEIMIADIYHQRLKCDDWAKYAATLGISGEDLEKARDTQ